MFHDYLGAEKIGVVVSLIAAQKRQWQFHCTRPYTTGLITKQPDKSPRLTARGTQGTPARPLNTGARSMTASANASSIADTAGLSTRVQALAQVKSPRAPIDARSSDFGISCAHEGYFKAEMRGFPKSHLRAPSDAVEGNRGHREVSTPSRTTKAKLPAAGCPPYPTVSYRPKRLASIFDLTGRQAPRLRFSI